MTDVLVPGGRDVRGVLEAPDDPDGIVVACPPHPQHQGSRTDPRLVAVSDALGEIGIACLRFDYGDWDEGYGEREDVRNAIRWAADRTDGPVGVFGYSFGAAQALLASTTVDRDVAGVAALAPPTRFAADLDVVDAVDALESPLLVLYGERDTTVDADPVVERATARGAGVTALPNDHFFIGNHDRIAESVREFFASAFDAE